MELLVEPIMELVKCLGRSACTYLDYHLTFDEAVSDLRRELEVLNRRKEDINLSIQSHTSLGKEVKHEVQGWLKHVQEINNEVEDIQEKTQRVKWYSKGRLGKLVRKKMEVVKRIHEQGSFPDGLIVDRPPSRGVIMPIEKVVGETFAKEKIWGYLMGNEVGMIGVCGIGGVGKTTIMKNINNELVRHTKFNKVIWVTVSYPLDVLKLQENIAHGFGEELRKDEDKEMRSAKLTGIMEKVRHVLILDDVWEKFSLNDVGIPKPTIESGSKIVITSRLIDVCQKMGCEIVKVEPLSFQESLSLFFDKVGSHAIEVPNLERILKLIVQECGGLPLAIVVIAESMKGEEDVKVWNNALTELRERVKSVTGSDQEIFKRLRFSYDRLDNSEIQSCFLYCSLFPEDYPFLREWLVEGWIDEGLIDVLPSRKVAYERGQAFLNRLVKNCLLEKTVDWGGDVFKMHDVLRDMAIKSIGPEFGYMVKAGMKLTEVPDERGWGNDLKKVSLMENNISKIPLGLCPKCPTLSTLILSNNPNLSEIPESFFEGMPELKVLDLSETGIEALPNSISNLEKLSSMRLRWCRRLRYLPSLAKLTVLKKLDLFESRIEEVPQGMEKLISLEYLDLRYCCNLKEIPMGMLSNLSNLQYLFFEMLKIEGEEVARMSKLETFEGIFNDIQSYNYFVKSQDFQILTDYHIKVVERIPILVTTPRVPAVSINNCDLGEECIVLPDSVKNLEIWKGKNMRSSLNKVALLEKATELRSCYIRGCEDMECVVDLDLSSYPVLDKLEELRLFKLPKLSALVTVEGVATPPHVFSNLKLLVIWDCSGMRKLLPLELLQAFQNLEEINVIKCKQMEEIIASSDSDASSDKFTFPKCPELKRIPMQLPLLDNGQPSPPPHLREIKIEKEWWESLPLLDNGQPSPPPRLREIELDEESKEWWESVEWDRKNLLHPFLTYSNECLVILILKPNRRDPVESSPTFASPISSEIRTKLGANFGRIDRQLAESIGNWQEESQALVSDELEVLLSSLSNIWVCDSAKLKSSCPPEAVIIQF
ncbi:hypothetical protein SLEP1_g55806 [Rubroshorea leprosula]|uniref:NB-ARC domain-containing protein n=1 Tax=Rubroshorea leprosula TaxID=152421 RepID=A0AAV5MIR1_9ROSI|nr:hypothetical protein SLEP1_g55806 [Rubroshorea leprosula]